MNVKYYKHDNVVDFLNLAVTNSDVCLRPPPPALRFGFAHLRSVRPSSLSPCMYEASMVV